MERIKHCCETYLWSSQQRKNRPIHHSNTIETGIRLTVYRLFRSLDTFPRSIHNTYIDRFAISYATKRGKEIHRTDVHSQRKLAKVMYMYINVFKSKLERSDTVDSCRSRAREMLYRLSRAFPSFVAVYISPEIRKQKRYESWCFSR